jgi:hypothetical protein
MSNDWKRDRIKLTHTKENYYIFLTSFKGSF